MKRKAVPMHPGASPFNLLGTALLRPFRLEREGKTEGLTLEITNDAGYEGDPTFYLRWDFVDDTLTLLVRSNGHTRSVQQWQTKKASLPVLRTKKMLRKTRRSSHR